MIIKSVSFCESNENSSLDFFSEKINLIYSSDNTKGKTTFLRLMLYALGFQIPSMYGIDFKKVRTEIEFSEKNTDFIAVRDSYNSIRIKTNESDFISYTLPSDHPNFLAFIFKYTKLDVLNNLLGFMYIDQEKGWTLLNRGTVIGRIKFSVEQLLAALNNLDINDLIERKRKLELDKKKYNALLDMQVLKDQALADNNSLTIDGFEKSDLEVELVNSQIRVGLEIQELEKKLKKIDAAVGRENRFKEDIDSMKLRINVEGFEEGVLVTKDNILGLNDYIKFLDSQRMILSIDLEKKRKEKKTIENRLFAERNKKYSNSIFEDSKNPFFTIEKDILSFNDINQESVQNALDTVTKELKKVNQNIKRNVKTNNTYINRIYRYVLQFVEELEFKEKINWNTDFIFTTDLKSLSGAALQKLIISFKMAFLKVVEEEMDTKLFFMLDSPKAKELDEKNTELIMGLINKYLDDNQIFIASIYDDYKFDKKITLINKAIEKR